MSTPEQYGCICGRWFASKSARTRHCNQCPTVDAYQQRVTERLEALARGADVSPAPPAAQED